MELAFAFSIAPVQAATPSLADSAVSTAGTTDYDSVAVTPSGSDRIIVASAHYRSTTDSLTDVIYEGEYFTSTCVERNNEYTVELWYLEDPADSGGDVEFYWSDYVDDVVIQVAAFDNVDLSSAVADYKCDNNGPSPWDYSVETTIGSTTTDQVLVGAATSYSGGGNVLDIDGSGTEIAADVIGNTSYALAYQTASASNSTMGWTGTSQWPGAMAMLVLNPSGGGGGGGGGAPAITWSQQPGASEDASFTISGNATAGDGVYDVYADVCSANDCGSYSEFFSATPSDGSFNSGAEDFSLAFFDLPNELIDITVYVEDDNSATTTYVYEDISINEDTVGPSLSFTTFPGSYSTSTLSFVGTATETETSVANVSVTYGLTGQASIGTFSATPTDGQFNEASEAFTYSVSSLAEGEYAIEVIAVNTHGAEVSRSDTTIVIDDSTAPTITMGNFGQTATTDTTPTFTGSASDQTPLATLEYRIYDVTLGSNEVNWTAVSVDDGALDEANEAFTFTPTALTDGAKLVIVRATDVIGNEFDATVDRVVIDAVDATAPTIRLQSIVPDPITDPSPVLSGRVDDNDNELTSNIAALYFKVDAGPWQTLPVRDGVIGDEVSEEFNITLTSLSLGSHTVTVRAVDAAGNDTDSGSNASQTFEVVAQSSSLPASSINTVVSFDARTYYDAINNDLIWGNGQLRLSEVVDPSVTELISNGSEQFGTRYANSQGVYDVKPSAAGGYWYTLSGSEFVYVNASEQTFFFDTQTWSGSLASELEEIYINGEYHVWLTTSNSLLGLNFGSSIEDGVDSFVSYSPSGSSSINIFEIDSRNVDSSDSYGIYFSAQGRLFYVNDPTFTDTAISSLSGLAVRSSATYYINDIVALFLDEERDHLWIGDYSTGVQRLSDQNTPLDLGDDAVLNYAGENFVFSIGVDKDGKPFFAGNSGLKIVLDDNGTDTNSADDTLQTLVDQYDLNLGVASHVQYFAGDSIVPSQFFIANRTGSFYYFSSNGTYSDPIDDQLIAMNLVGDYYPAEIRRFYMPDETTVYFSTVHKGAYKADLNKQFAASGYTQTATDSQVDEYLDADYLVFESVNRVDTSNAAVTYEVSNDGGDTWHAVEIGDTVDFSSNDYRVSLRITMTRGSTPVLTNVALSYAAYASGDPADRTLSDYAFVSIPSSVNSGDSFSFGVQLLDEVGQLLKVSDTATISLKQSSNNQTISSFSLSDLSFAEGVASITGANAAVVGDHYLTVTDGSITANSSAITFVGNDSSGSTDDSEDDDDEDTSSNTTEETSSTTSIGGVYASATNVLTSLFDASIGENEDSDEIVDAGVPKILKFIVSAEDHQNGTKIVTVEWDVTGADWVEISGVGKDLASKGKKTIEVSADTVIQLVARNEHGSSYSKEEITFDPSFLERIFPSFLSATLAEDTSFVIPVFGLFLLVSIIFWWIFFLLKRRRRKEDESI